MNRPLAILTTTAALLLGASLAPAQQAVQQAAQQNAQPPAQKIATAQPVTLGGDLAYADELSGVAFYGDLLIACPDEGAELNVLKPTAASYELVSKINLLSGSDEEVDMEGAASDGKYLYVVGSHSLRRKKIDEDKAYEKNRKRLTNVAPHPDSYSLFRLTLNADGALASQEQISLQDILEKNDILQPYLAIPSKENGIDVEGVAVRQGRLFVGFRGPVLRGNFVPVLSFEFEHPDDYQLSFVPLDGRGIRDLVAVEDGFLILAGPVGDGDAACRLYAWNGKDCVPGDGAAAGRITPLGPIPSSVGAKPEGAALTSEDADQWRLLIVSDGETSAKELIVSKP
jgi:hypothetical protein